MTEVFGVTPVPLQSFYYSPDTPMRELPVVNLIRFSLCKTRQTFLDTYRSLTGRDYQPGGD